MRLYSPELTAEQIIERNEALMQILPHIKAQARFRARRESRDDLIQDAAELFLRRWPKYIPGDRNPPYAAAVLISAACARFSEQKSHLKRCGDPGPYGEETYQKIDEKMPEPWEWFAVGEEAEHMLQTLNQDSPDLAALLRVQIRQHQYRRFSPAAVRRIRELLDIPEPPPVPTKGEQYARRVEDRRRRYDAMKERAAELLDAGFGQQRTALATGLSRSCVRLLIASRRLAATANHAAR